MALFGRKRALLQKAVTSDWKNRLAKDELLKEIRKCDYTAAEVIPLLLHRDPEVRQTGSQIFVEECDSAAVHKLVGETLEQNPSASKHIFAVLPRVPEDLVEAMLEDLLASRNERKQRLAWELVPSLGLEVRGKYLSRALHQAPHSMRPNLLRQLLRDEKPERLIDTLVEFARSDDRQLSQVALDGAAGIPDPRIAELMVDRFAYGDAPAREQAYKYLVKMGRAKPEMVRGRILELLAAGDDEIRRMGVSILLNTGRPADVLPGIMLFVRDLIGWLRRRILDTLLSFGDDLLVPALALLEHPDERVRASALVLCEHFDDPRVVPPTIKLLDSDDWWLRVLACETLGRVGDKRAVGALVKSLADADTRWAAIDALGRLGAPEALKHLIPLIDDPRTEVRLEVITALAMFNDKRLLERLKHHAQNDPSSEVRTRAAEVARRMADQLHVKVSNKELSSVKSQAAIRKPIEKLLVEVRRRGASDVHITVDEPPFIRVRGELKRMEGVTALSARHSKNAVVAILNEAQKEALDTYGEVDFCHAIPEIGRYRGNAFLQRRGLCAVFRVIPTLPPTFSELRLPTSLREILDMNQGLVIVSGPAGCGKSTTMAALVNLINETKPLHIITLEDPIEFVHPRKQALVDQREVGTHTKSFARALRAALREDPDVILVGEMRDPETIRMALTAAETGHLVIATMHTNRAQGCIDRLVESFVPEEQPQVRLTLADTLKVVIAQNLLIRADEKGRVAMFEVLRVVQSIAGLIRENKTHQIPNVMVMGRRLGMQTVDMALTELVESGLITPETAYGRADKPEKFVKYLSPAVLAELEKHNEELAT